VTQDAVDRIIEQWRRERPDLDLDAMELIGRLGRLGAYVARAVDETFNQYGIAHGEYDVLAALRRSGAPFTLTPSDLADTLMLSRGGMTSRLDRLERAGLVERRANEDDRRSLLIRLTDAGRTLVDEVTTQHVAREEALLSDLAPRDRRALDRIVRALLRQFES
jgi:DNA-binding MarR family transcriptional regulator